MTTKKAKTIFACTACGDTFSKWMGKCTSCDSWSTVIETKETAHGTQNNQKFASWSGSSGQLTPLKDIEHGANVFRYDTKISELNRVLGGGLAKGSVILLGGDPGIGKSTLVLQTCYEIAKDKKVMYFTGEESLPQVNDRAKRLGVAQSEMLLGSEIEIEKIIQQATDGKADLVVVDSIQTMFSGLFESSPGSVSQVRECAAMLTRMAKSYGISVILIGHVTKEGSIAGPRVLEHMVDTVLQFEGTEAHSYRLLRSVKNRYGGAHEMGIFAMEESGLKEVLNSSELFITAHQSPVSGSVVHAAIEGSRPFLIEVQVLVEDSINPNPKRHATGFESSRLQLLLAILNKHASLHAFDQNVYMKVVGGVKLTEPAADLSALIAAYSSLKGKAFPSKWVAFGEVGLAGELRPVQNPELRLTEAAKLGYTCAIVPSACKIKKIPAGMEIKQVSNVSKLLEVLKTAES